MSKSITMGIEGDHKTNYEDLEQPNYMGSRNNSQPTNNSVASKKQVYIPLKGGNMSNVKKKITETTNNTVATTKRVINNAEQFVQSIALLTVATFSYYAVKQLDLNPVVELTITIALAVIGLRGAVEFVKFLDKEKI